MPDVLGAWGFLPIVGPLFAFVAVRLGALAFAGEKARASDRGVAGVVLAFASVVLTVRLLSFVHAVNAPCLIGALGAAALALFVTRRRAPLEWPTVKLDAGLGLAGVVVAAGVGLVALAARWLPVWQWDSLGYHLPFVHFTLAARSVAGVPSELEYIGSYPHDVELFFVALRACLPDDRLVDLGQTPFGLAGAVVTAALARRWQATRETALMAGGAWLLLPAVFLQLPTNYVDVATAVFLLAAIYFILAPPSTRSVLLGAIALGLFVGSKPSAPIPAAVLLALLTVRAVRARQGRLLPYAALGVVVFGAESYVDNAVHHLNPIWPVRVDVGPIHLPGLHPLSELLAAGANAQRLTGPLPWRFVRSLVALGSVPTFDMRVGGYGPLFLAALPFSVAWLVRRKDLALGITVVATLISPDPAIARYILAFPALVLAAAAPSTLTLAVSGRHARLTLGLVASVLGVLQLVYAEPGLVGEGPPLLAYASMSEGERALAVGADGPPTQVAAARARVGAGEAFAFDENMDLCDEAWDSAQSYPVLFLPSALGVDDVGREVDLAHIRVIAAGDTAPAGAWAVSHPLQFARLSALPSCRKGTCSLFVRR